jgi:hypothetical protein
MKYSTSEVHDNKPALIEEYPAKKEPGDSEIYRKVHGFSGYRETGDPYLEKRQEACLVTISNNKETLEHVL